MKQEKQNTPLTREEGTQEESRRNEPPTPLSKRILALCGAILMVILTIFFAYSIATGAIFAW